MIDLFNHGVHHLLVIEFPSSTRQSDNASKSGVERRCKRLPQHLDVFPWLAVSRCPGKKGGAFCISCVLFAAGSRSVKSQLVNVPLKKFDDLTGTNGVHAKGNAAYHSPQIQNELISAVGYLVKEEVLRCIKKARFWAILADETTNGHHREQLVVVIRYVLNDTGAWRCYEDPVAIIDLHANIAAEQDGDGELRLSGTAIGV